MKKIIKYLPCGWIFLSLDKVSYDYFLVVQTLALVWPETLMHSQRL